MKTSLINSQAHRVHLLQQGKAENHLQGRELHRWWRRSPSTQRSKKMRNPDVERSSKLQVYDMNGFYFLVKFQTTKAVEHIHMGVWTRQGQVSELQWWSPMIGALPESFCPDWC